MAEDYFDLVDLDVFGSDSSFTAAAMSAPPLPATRLPAPPACRHAAQRCLLPHAMQPARALGRLLSCRRGSRAPAARRSAVRHGGLLYLTSTDGFCSGGKRPGRSLASYGGYLRALPWSNEQGLRMVIGGGLAGAWS
jgi:hypothetical protein